MVVLKMKNDPASNKWYAVTNLIHNWWIPLTSITSQQNWPIHFEELKLQHLTYMKLFTCVWLWLPPMFLKHLLVSPSKVQFRFTYTLGIPLNMTFSFDTFGVDWGILFDLRPYSWSQNCVKCIGDCLESWYFDLEKKTRAEYMVMCRLGLEFIYHWSCSIGCCCFTTSKKFYFF